MRPSLVVAWVVPLVAPGDLSYLGSVSLIGSLGDFGAGTSEFRAAFPDWRQEITEPVIDGATVLARLRCTGTQQGAWRGLAPTGRRMTLGEVSWRLTSRSLEPGDSGPRREPSRHLEPLVEDPT